MYFLWFSELKRRCLYTYPHIYVHIHKHSIKIPLFLGILTTLVENLEKM